jgi:leader peptidase (prepilin peptidase)/N-methyltransferase
VAGLVGGMALRPRAAGLAAVGPVHPAAEAAAGGTDRSTPGPVPAALGAGPRLRWLPAATAVALGLVAGRLGGRPELFPFGVLAVVGVALAFVDVTAHRLPDSLTLPAYPAVLAGLAVTAGVRGDGGRLVTAAAASLTVAGCYLLLVLARPRQLGLGDLKLAGLLGLGLGWLGWPALLAGSVLPFILFSLCALGLLAAGRVGRRTALPFGPFLVTGALLVVLATAGR